MRKPANPHDQAFKRLMRQKPFAQAFIEQYFSAQEFALFNMGSLELVNANYIHQKLQADVKRITVTDGLEQSESHSDVVYKVRMKDGSHAYVVFLFEHQSKPEEMMAFRLLEYSALLMRQHLDQGNNKLPVVIPVVFYHGRQSPYPYSTDIFDCFEAPAVAKDYYLKPFKLVDVTIIPDEELKRNIITAPYQLLAKHIRDNDLLPVIKDLAETGILAKNVHIGDGKLFIDMVYYALSAGEISNRKAFEEMLLTQPEEVRKPFMSLLEQYQAEARQQGMQQGMQQGVQQGMQQGMQQSMMLMAKKLLAKGMTMQEVVDLTGLNLETVKRLQTERQVN